MTVALGQGSIIFDNYGSTPYMPIRYTTSTVNLTLDMAGRAGQGVADVGFHVDLFYYIGVASYPAQLTDLGLSIPINSGKQDLLGNHGYFDGQIVHIPGYTSGPVTFQMIAWYTTTTGPDGEFGGATYAQAFLKGQSGLWLEPSPATGQTPAPVFRGLPGPNGATLLSVFYGPEPSTFGLISLGTFWFMALRRRR